MLLLIKTLSGSRVKLQMITIAMVCFIVIPWLRTFMVMPKRTVPFPLPQDYRYRMFKSCQGARPKVSPEERLNSFPTQSHNEKEEGLKACLQNKLFWSNLLYYCHGYLQFVSFMGSFVGWIETIYSRDQDINFYTTPGAQPALHFGGGNFHEISFDDVIVLIQPWYNFFADGHIQ